MKRSSCSSAFIAIIGIFASLGFAQQNVDNNLWQIVWSIDPATSPHAVWEMESGFDIDQDGKGEILFYSPNPVHRAFLYEANGDNNYELIWTYDPEPIDDERGLAVGDINLDGRDEIVLVVNTNAGMDFALKVFSWDGVNDNGIPAEPNGFWDPPRDNALNIDVETCMKIVNLDSDPEPEIIIPINFTQDSNYGFLIVSFTGGPEGDLADFDSWKTEYINGRVVRSMDVGDLDNDGLMEVWAAETETKRLTIYENTGNADEYVVANTLTPQLGFFWAPSAEALVTANFDGGYGEVYIADDDGRVYVGTNSGDVSTITFANNFKQIGRFELDQRGIAVGDQDQDGFGDLYVGGEGAHKLLNWEYTGGSIADSNSYSYYELLLDPLGTGESNFETSSIQIGDHPRGDLDGDGKKEVVISSHSSLTDYPHVLVIEHPQTGSTEVTPIAIPTFIPEDFALQQNYPNPFNPETKIVYDLSQGANVRLEVFTLLGQKVATLVDKHQGIGRYEAIWDGRDDYGKLVPSGVYLYRMHARDVVLTRKMILAR